MSWICIGCQQVQEDANSFAPVLNHTHIVRPVEGTSVEKIRADVAEKMTADGATPEQIEAATAAIKETSADGNGKQWRWPGRRPGLR